MGSVKSSLGSRLELQLGYTWHFISQQFNPDPVGELVYQGVASQALHEDRDNALEGDLRYVLGAHSLGAGFYVGAYDVENSDSSLVFAADVSGQQTSNVPLRVSTRSSATNVVSSIYLSDLWRLSPAFSVDLGLRGDDLTGYTHAQQLSPRLNLSFRPNPGAALHAGVARYLQVPSFLGIAPSAQAAFAGTTAEGPPESPCRWPRTTTNTTAASSSKRASASRCRSTATTNERSATSTPVSSASYPYSRRSTTATATSGEPNWRRATKCKSWSRTRISPSARTGSRVS